MPSEVDGSTSQGISAKTKLGLTIASRIINPQHLFKMSSRLHENGPALAAPGPSSEARPSSPACVTDFLLRE